MAVKIFQCKNKKLSGTDYHEVYLKAFAIYKKIKRKTKRRPYLRSTYFSKDKIFIDYFWDHLWQKNWRDRSRRMKFYPCAVELLEKSRYEPVSKQNPNKPTEILHRFAGMTKEKELFFVQVKEDKKNDQKFFLSVFPEE
ncbi:MAG: hypothetical protein NTZ97_00290 [Candidatus Moranbacteria bacterium]|nr:hypothetical protein [Candidatus Moranbacteria bacterium]